MFTGTKNRRVRWPINWPRWQTGSPRPARMLPSCASEMALRTQSVARDRRAKRPERRPPAAAIPGGAPKVGTAMVADKRPPVVKAADLPEPHRISADDFEEIVCRFKIPLARRPALRDFLDEMVEEFAGAISRERSLPNQRADRGQIDKARKAIAKARVAINLASGPAAKAALRRTAGCIGTMLSASWIRGRFPHDRIAPDLHFWPDDGRSVRTSARVPARPVPIDDLSRDERAYFAEHRARELIVAILNV